DRWRRGKDDQEQEHEQLEEDQEEAKNSIDDRSEDSDFHKARRSRARGKYKCETCNKVFRSYQALGGHRASHKKIKAININSSSAQEQSPEERENVGNSTMVVEKIHECPVCYRVFSSGQALGGHKRSHVLGSGATTTITVASKSFSKFGETLIDLNLPAPIDDDDISQIELSAVSDAEFINPIKH
ncbi:unnamed protein product, partial [Ilex paraguariensis]